MDHGLETFDNGSHSVGEQSDTFNLPYTPDKSMQHLRWSEIQQIHVRSSPAKTLSLHLMHKDPSMYGRFRHDHLTDEIYSRTSSQN